VKAVEAAGPEPAADDAPDPYVPGAGDRGYRVTRYELDLDYRVASNRLAGRARMIAVAARDLPAFTLDLSGLRAVKVTVDSQRPRRQRQRPGKLSVQLNRTMPAGQPFEIEVGYQGSPRPIRGRWGEVGWEELSDGVIVAGQPEGAPTWFPCNDRPDDKASYRISVTTESPYTVLANGTLVDRRVHSSRTTWVYDQPQPMASYLATVQIGRYTVAESDSQPVRQLLATTARLRRAAQHDFARQTKMITAFQEMFGPYPFDSYTVVVTDDELEIPLEAQSLSIFGSNHVDGQRGSERLIAHELAHQWFGNSLTLGRWRDVWLHEGFACYAEWLWSERSGGQAASTLARREWQRLQHLPQDFVLANPGPDRMFDDRLYKRGALTLHALRQVLGDRAFFSMLSAWALTHRYSTVTTGDFVQHATAASSAPNRDVVARLLGSWLQRPALPDLPVRAW
jgi:aminopeptidase N